MTTLHLIKESFGRVLMLILGEGFNPASEEAKKDYPSVHNYYC